MIGIFFIIGIEDETNLQESLFLHYSHISLQISFSHKLINLFFSTETNSFTLIFAGVGRVQLIITVI